jgi:hypothetical protein
MDALYGAFKSATYACGELVLMGEMKMRGVAARMCIVKRQLTTKMSLLYQLCTKETVRSSHTE